MNNYKTQTTRSKRIYFLRKLLQDGIGNPDDELLDSDETNRAEAPAPIPAALALMMNTTKFIDMAPGKCMVTA